MLGVVYSWYFGGWAVHQNTHPIAPICPCGRKSDFILYLVRMSTRKKIALSCWLMRWLSAPTSVGLLKSGKEDGHPFIDREREDEKCKELAKYEKKIAKLYMHINRFGYDSYLTEKSIFVIYHTRCELHKWELYRNLPRLGNGDMKKKEKKIQPIYFPVEYHPQSYKMMPVGFTGLVATARDQAIQNSIQV